LELFLYLYRFKTQPKPSTAMTNKEAIRRTKLYHEGLEKAVALPIPEAAARELEEIINDPEVEENHRMILRLWKEVSAPLDVAIAFIYNNRALPQYKELIVNNEDEMPFIQPDEIYDTLKTLLPPTVGEFLSVLQISSHEKEELLDCVERGDKDSFVSLLKKTGCDAMPLGRLCSHCMDDVMAGLTMTHEERAFSLEHLVGTMSKSEDDERCREAVAQMQSSIEQLEEKDTPKSTNQFYSDFFDYLVSQLTADLHYYWNYYDLFTPKERNLIESILDHPLAMDLVDQIWEEYKASFDFTLPDDFFHSRCTADDTEHLHVKLSVEDEGAALFTEFINYLAEKGYIEDSPAVKNLFAYRLTGYYRPDGELSPIVWNGKNGKSYELIYLIRSLCDRGDYKKMRRFFEGPEWVKEKDSSYAHSADTEFRRKMSELYPGVCEFRK
jgi:hypothetical protein